jgi:hypothetical protein
MFVPTAIYSKYKYNMIVLCTDLYFAIADKVRVIYLEGWKFLYQLRDISFSRILLHEVSTRIKACICKKDFSVERDKNLEKFQDSRQKQKFYQ